MAHSRLLALSVAFSAVAIAACIPGIPADTQSGGNAPLVVDLDEAGTPFVVAPGDSAAEITISVRGPNKGSGERGGITGMFTAVGGTYCVIIDPANIWEGPNGAADAALDDGDADLFVGRASDYDGTPGKRIGDFHADYVDALGIPHDIDENLCQQFDLNGLPGAHSGKASIEYCAIETEAGVPYIVKAETLAVPPNGDILKVAMRVSTGPCLGAGGAPFDENTLTGDN